MKARKIATNSRSAAVQIAENLELPFDVVNKILSQFSEMIVKTLSEEIPFKIDGLGKFYLTYRVTAYMTKYIPNKERFDGKVYKSVNFRPTYTAKDRLHGWVHDIGIKDNISTKELMKLKIKPEEITKLRRNRLLVEQRAAGFNAELLFDDSEIPDADKQASKNEPDSPSVEELLTQLGINMSGDE